MHEPILIAALVAHLMILVLRPWRKLLDWQPPPMWVPPANAIRAGFYPTRKRKGRYPAGFA